MMWIFPRPTILALKRFILLLVLFQASRALVAWILRLFARPYPDLAYLCMIQSTAIVLVLLPVLLWNPPSAGELGLNWRGTGPWERRFYILGAVLFGACLAYSAIRGQLAQGLYSLLIVPAFEEILFRGYGWHSIRAGCDGPRSDLVALILVAMLYLFWQLGYVDPYLRARLAAFPFPGLGHVYNKIAIRALLYSLLTGLARWKTGKTFAPLMVHSLLNALLIA